VMIESIFSAVQDVFFLFSDTIDFIQFDVGWVRRWKGLGWVDIEMIGGLA